MKKITFLALFAIISVFTFAQERIAVFPFEVLDNAISVNESVQLYRNFSNQFTNMSVGRLDVIPRQEIEKLINTEAKFQLTDFSSREKTAEMERVLNGTQILSGAIGKVGNRINIAVSLYTYPELKQLPGGTDLRVSDVNELFDKIPELVRSMQSEIGKGGTGTNTTNRNTAAQPPANMVRVEGGTFQMGTASGGGSNERPVHTVNIKSFYMGKYEVTQREWQAIMGNNPSYFKGDNLPVENVSWFDAIEYCNKLSIKEGLTPAYRGSGDNIICDWNANGYRLPTEAEWEFAAKGGIKDLLTAAYSGSNSVDAVAWYDGNSGRSTHTVGTKAANSLGIYDMSGNVWEWCWDWFGNYSSGSQADPRGHSSGAYRVIRGGGWSASAAYVSSANRDYGCTPSYRSHGLGFRLVRNAN
jgi:formylglycine-generating enzyme required for sulfatase activity